MKRIKVNVRSLVGAIAYRQRQTPVLVEPCFACPHCGERRMDWLSNHGDDTVTCETCCKVYHI